MTVAKNYVGPPRIAGGASSRRHRVTIDEQTAAEQRLGLQNEATQRLVIGLIEPLNSPLRLDKTKLLRVNFFATGDDPGDRAETHADPWPRG